MTDTIHTPGPPAVPPGPGGPSSDEVPPEPVAPPTTGPLGGVALVAGTLALGAFVSWWLVAVIGALVVSIVLHEAGHYLVARRSGMKVTEFFLGMGPRVWSFQRGETEYGVKAFPVGAYVRIIGMSNLEHVDPDDEPRTYRAQSYPKRLATVLAGPAMNILIGVVLLYGIIATTGVPADTWAVSGVVAGSSAADAGVVDGDRIVSIDGREVGDFDSLGDVVEDVRGQPVEVVVERDGEQVALTTVMGWSLTERAASAIPSSPALQEGTRVVAFDGEDVVSYEGLRTDLAGAEGDHELLLEIGRDQYTLAVTGPIDLPDDGARGFFGVGRDQDWRSVGPITGVGETATQLGELTTQMVTGVGRLFSPAGLSRYAEMVVDSTSSEETSPAAGDLPRPAPVDDGVRVPVEDIPEERPVSIVGIVQLGSQAGEAGGARAMLQLLALVNLFLAMINLVPLLPFDGGHAAVATYEAIRGAIARRPYRVDMAKLMPVTYGVVAVLMFLGLTSIWLDVRDPIQLP